MSENLTIIKTKEDLSQKLHEINPNGNMISISNLQFDCDVSFSSPHIIKIENCVFNKIFSAKGSTERDVIIKNTQFNGFTDFSNFTFMKNSRFHGCLFNGKVKFHNTKFQGLADFYSTTFNEITIFFKTDFLDRTVFSAAVFNENVLFTYTLITDHFLLRGATFNKGLDLSLSILSGDINLFGLNVPNYKSVPDIDDETDYDNAVCKKGLIPHKNKRETFRILKKELINQGNSIDALAYAAKEKLAYAQQLKSDRKFKRGKWLQRSQNRFILFLGKWSNSHGESWLRGALFTLLIGLIFFTPSFFSTKEWDSNNFLEYYFQFMLPTHPMDFMSTLKPSAWFYFLDFTGRIFIAFGIYQTVVAFRKYHTK